MSGVTSLHSLTGKTPVLYSGEGGSRPPEGSCEYCSKLTTNPRFCSLSCSTSWQGKAKAWPIGYCKQCKRVFSRYRNYAKVYCSRSCAATFNNKSYPKRTRTTRNKCGYCSAPVPKKYCTVQCQQNNRYQIKINLWLTGKDSGLSTGGVVKGFVKRWLIETRGNQCELCGWAKINLTTGKVPLVADHTDGNWERNRPENLRLLCANCDSLQPTYKALNRGNGRGWRRNDGTT